MYELSNKCLVSIIMSVHNEPQNYIETAIQSIINQTYKKIEFIIIDDFSNRECSNFLQDECKKYSNVSLYRNTSNIGLTRSLNIGIHYATGKYIARMDADDYSLPSRIEKQVIFLEKHSDIDVIGTGVISFGDSYKFISPAFGYNNDEAQCELFFSSTLCHPSVMIRKSFLDKNNLLYDENVKKGQDYDLWERCSIYGKITVLPEVLLFYRIHSNQISSKNNEEQNNTTVNIWKRRLSRIGIITTENELNIHLLLTKGRNNNINVKDVKEWIDKIIKGNNKFKIAPQKLLINNLQMRLTLYKIRNGYYFDCNILDLYNLFKTLIKRFCALIKLKITIYNVKL